MILIQKLIFISQYSYIDFTMKKNLFMSDYSKQFQNNLFNKNFLRMNGQI